MYLRLICFTAVELRIRGFRIFYSRFLAFGKGDRFPKHFRQVFAAALDGLDFSSASLT